MDSEHGAAAGRPTVFISHHSSHEQSARRLKKILERNGFIGWMAPDDVPPGKAFDDAIVDQIGRSDVVVLLFSRGSDTSRHVKRELILADNQGKPVYPVRLEEVPAEGLAYWLNDQQWVDWFDGKDATIQRAIDAIRMQIAEAAGASPDALAAEDVRGFAERFRRPRASYTRSIWQRRIGWSTVIAGLLAAAYIAVPQLGPQPEDDTIAEPLIREGLWETRLDVGRILRTENPDADAMRLWEAAFELDAPRFCVTANEARMPGIGFFDPDGRNQCALVDIVMADGSFTVMMECRPNSLEGDNLNLAMDGQYTSEGYVADAEYAYDQGTDREFRFLVRQTARYLGPCSEEEDAAAERGYGR